MNATTRQERAAVEVVRNADNHTGGDAHTGGDTDDARELARRGDTRSIMRLGFWVLGIGFGLFVAWAAFAALDEGVPAPATVSIETRRKPVQHIGGGIIKAVRVKEGATVESGEVLVELDEAAAQATHEAIRQTYFAQRAHEGRLQAEASGAATIAFHADLRNAADPVAQQHMRVQKQLFDARRSAHAAEIAAATQNIAGLDGQIAGMQQALESRRDQAALQARHVDSVKALAAEGFAPRNQALQLEQAQADLRAGMAETQSTIQRSRSAIAETRLRIAQRRQEQLQDTATQLAALKREVDANQERLRALTDDLARLQIRAPVRGQVFHLTVNGPGAVVTPGQRLMDIVPSGEALLLDAHIPNHVIDRIKVGDTTEVRFSSFANAPQLVVQGRLVSLSADAIHEQTPLGSQAYFLGRVAITPEGQKALGERQLMPGMVAEVLIKTGERSLLTYLLHPLTKRIATTMTEP